MEKIIAIGIQDFGTLIQNNYFYIDKTSFIQEWWEAGDSVTLITRPRRFGKTLNMSMLEYFFSIKYAKHENLFEGFSIWQQEKYRKLQGTYPVISLSFATVKETNFEATKLRIYQLLTDLYNQNHFLLDSGVLQEKEREFFLSVGMNMSEVTATFSIYQLCNYLHRYYGKKVIVLLDEYDTPMQEAYVHGYWNELVFFTRSLFHATFKTNPWLERGMMTGITRISKESVFSDLNHLKVVTTTSEDYATSFGFTEQEVFEVLHKFGLEKQKEQVKRWYDGFVFGKVRDIYNPWSILNFLDTGKIKAYWANTSSHQLVDKLIREGSRNLKQCFENLLQGNSIFCSIEEQIVYQQLDYSETAIWTLLIASGYLKVVNFEQEEYIEDGKEPLYELALTNYEVERTFRTMVRGWFSTVNVDYNDFIKALLVGNVEEMNVYMNRVALRTFSYFDTGKQFSQEEPERFYHGFVLGLLVELYGDYVIISNRESGLGRYDVMIEPKDKDKKAFILEFKVHHSKKEQTLEDTVQEALKQIEKRKYETILLEKGFQKEQIYQYGFAFLGKQVLIGMKEGSSNV